MKKFVLKEANQEISFKNRETIKEGIVLSSEIQDSSIIATFDTLEEARKELKKYKSSIIEYPHYYLVTEYYIEEVFDDDGESIECGDITDVSEIKIELIAKPSYEQVAAFNNMKDAVAAQDDYIHSGKGEAYLSFI